MSYSSFADDGSGGRVETVLLCSSSDSSKLSDDRSLIGGESMLLQDELEDVSDEESSDSYSVSSSFAVKVLRCIKFGCGLCVVYMWI